MKTQGNPLPSHRESFPSKGRTREVLTSIIAYTVSTDTAKALWDYLTLVKMGPLAYRYAIRI